MIDPSNQADIYFYNTKLDSSPIQNFRAVFLAGTSSSLFTSAPYLQATQVSGVNPHISLNLINPATHGNISLQSGSSASVILNNLYFPSAAEVAASVASPSASLASDLFLAVRGGQFVELLTYNFGGGDVLTQSSILYSNPAPMVTTVGSFTAGQTFSNVPFSQIFDGILYPELGPLAIFEFTNVPSNNTLERHHSSAINVNISYTLTKRTYNIAAPGGSSLIYRSPSGVVNTTAGINLSGTGLIISAPQSATLTVAAADIAADLQNGRFTFSVVAEDTGPNSYTVSKNIEFVYPYIYAFSTNIYPLNNTGMSSLWGDTPGYVKVVNGFGSQSIALINQTTPRYLYFMYPSIHGTLSVIKDGNDFTESLVGGTWTYSYNVPINDPASRWTGINYNIFRKTLPVIINPSQNYKFIF